MQQSSPKHRWNPWPVSIIAFFSIAILGCVTFVIFCNRHPADLVMSDYYEQEVRYQKQIDSKQRAQQLLQVATVQYDPARRVIMISLPPAQAEGAAGTIQLYRPSAAGLDRTFKLATDRKGMQSLDGSNLAPGLWKARLLWSNAGKEYLVEESFTAVSTMAGLNR
jgi:hypothetical protein